MSRPKDEGVSEPFVGIGKNQSTVVSQLNPPTETTNSKAVSWGQLFQIQVERCWKKPYSGAEAEKPVAAFTIRLKRDGTLEGAPIAEKEPSTPYLRLYQESALRALVACQPYDLPAALFNEWKYFAPVFTEKAAGVVSRTLQAVGTAPSSSTTKEQTKADDVLKHRDFFARSIDELWMVHGVTYPDNPDRNPTCFADRVYNDGSRFQLSRDLVKDELYIWFRDNTWEIKEPFGLNTSYSVRINIFNSRNQIIGGGDMKFSVLAKNVITLRRMAEKAFLEVLLRGDKLVFVMPGTVPNTTVTFNGAAKMITRTLSDCAKASRDIDNSRKNEEVPDLTVPAKARELTPGAQPATDSDIISTTRQDQQPPEPVATLIQLWGDANGRCRGGPGDAPATNSACSERERLGERLDGLDWCYGMQGQIGAEMSCHQCIADSLRPQRGKKAPIVSVNAQALEGNWYSDNVTVCSGIAGQTEGLLTFKSGHFIGYETDCNIRNSKVNGPFIALQMLCHSEGMQSRSSEIVEFLSDRQMRRTVLDQGKRHSFTLTRCSAKPQDDMPHNRPCDIAQDHPGNLNPDGGNAIMFGLCGLIEDLPTGKEPSRHHWWNAYNCGYQAYRQDKAFGVNPYHNDELETRWSAGWNDARKACRTGKGPFDSSR